MGGDFFVRVDADDELLAQLFRLPQLIRVSVMDHIVASVAPNSPSFRITHCYNRTIQIGRSQSGKFFVEPQGLTRVSLFLR